MEFPGKRWAHTLRGTGCHLSSCIAGYMAHGFSIDQCVDKAKDYVNLLFDNYDTKAIHVTPAWYTRSGA